MKKTFISVLAATLAAIMLVPFFAACGETGNGGETDPADDTTTAADTVTEPTDTTPADTTPAETPTDTTVADTTPADTTTKAPDTTAEPVEEDYIANVKWSLGYVGSDSNSSYKNKLNPTGGMYSFTEIIKVTKDSVITFTDDNTNSNGDTNFASASAYVFSNWKKSGEQWVLDTSASNLNGTAAEHTDAAGKRTYFYVVTKDVEYIRVCFRSGQSATFTPAAYPEINVKSKYKPEIIIEKSDDSNPIDADATEVATTWHTGYVGSSTNAYGNANKLAVGGSGYAYTDVIELAEKGSKLVFIDPKRGSTSDNAYCVSFWTKSGTTWNLDTSARNIAGSPSEVVTNNASLGIVYTYISSADNECVRLCYRSDGAENTNPPKVYLSKTSEKGTVEQMGSAYEEFYNWIENDKTRANYSVLAGKTINFIGDSYLAGNGLDKNYVWPAILGKKYNMNMMNYGMNGSTVSNYVTTNNPMCVRYTSMASNNPDIVVIEGGRNDYNKAVPIGTNDSTDTKTFKGALRTLIEGVKKKYPNAVIICVTCWEVGGSANAAGNVCSKYGTAMIELCNAMNVPVLNAMDQTATGVKMTDATFRSKYCMTASDISHLNLEGMKLVFPYFEKQIAEIYTNATK